MLFAYYFGTCINTVITYTNSLIRVSVISFITESVYMTSCLSGQILLSQQAPVLFNYLLIWVTCPCLFIVCCLFVLGCCSYSLLSIHHLFCYYMCSVSEVIYCCHVTYVSINSYSLFIASGVFLLLS